MLLHEWHEYHPFAPSGDRTTRAASAPRPCSECSALNQPLVWGGCADNLHAHCIRGRLAGTPPAARSGAPLQLGTTPTCLATRIMMPSKVRAAEPACAWPDPRTNLFGPAANVVQGAPRASPLSRTTFAHGLQRAARRPCNMSGSKADVRGAVLDHNSSWPRNLVRMSGQAQEDSAARTFDGYVARRRCAKRQRGPGFSLQMTCTAAMSARARPQPAPVPVQPLSRCPDALFAHAGCA